MPARVIKIGDTKRFFPLSPEKAGIAGFFACDDTVTLNSGVMGLCCRWGLFTHAFGNISSVTVSPDKRNSVIDRVSGVTLEIDSFLASVTVVVGFLILSIKWGESSVTGLTHYPH